MANETLQQVKRQLLVSKWSERQAAFKANQEQLATLTKEVSSLMDDRNSLQSYIDEIEPPYAREALLEVKYWMHDVLVLRKPVSDPRKILRLVEDVL